MDRLKNGGMIRLSKSCLGELEKQYVLDVLDHEFLGMGAEVQKFEGALNKFFGRPVVCVSSGTAALHLALQGLGLGEGDEVLVQSLTYVATFQAITACGARPIACEVNQQTLCIDLEDAKRKFTPNTKVIMPVHYAGGLGNLDEIYEFASEVGIRVVEDAAHAFGTLNGVQRVGGFGDVACFSFDGIKNITAGEGGCIVTDDIQLLNKIKDSRLLGVQNDTLSRFKGERSWVPEVVEQGWRYHMSNVMAAIGLAQLEKFEQFSKKRRLLAKRYEKNLKNHQSIKTLKLDYDQVVPHIFVVRNVSSLSRDRIVNSLNEKGIQTGHHYFPNHRLKYFRQSFSGTLEVTDNIYEQLITLPLHPDLSIEEIDYITECLLLEIQ